MTAQVVAVPLPQNQWERQRRDFSAKLITASVVAESLVYQN